MDIELEELQAYGTQRPEDIKLQNQEVMRRKLAWVKACQDAIQGADDGKEPSIAHVNFLMNAADKALDGMAGGAAAGIPVVGTEAKNIFTRMKDYLFKNIRKGTVNIVEGRKKRKYATIFAGMGIGLAVGIIIGTVVFPGIGSAVGGVIGAAAAGMSGVVAGALFGVLGAFIGTFISRKLAKKLPESASSYQLLSENTKKLSKVSGLDEVELTKLHAYVRNRKHQFPENSPIRQAIKDVDTKAFKQGSKTGLEKLVFFLVSELEELESMNTTDEKYVQDIILLRNVLKKLQDANINPVAKNHIKAFLTKDDQPSTSLSTRADQVDLQKELELTRLQQNVKQAKNFDDMIVALAAHNHELVTNGGKALNKQLVINKLIEMRDCQNQGKPLPRLGPIAKLDSVYGLEERVMQLVQVQPRAKRPSAIFGGGSAHPAETRATTRQGGLQLEVPNTLDMDQNAMFEARVQGRMIDALGLPSKVSVARHNTTRGERQTEFSATARDGSEHQCQLQETSKPNPKADNKAQHLTEFTTTTEPRMLAISAAEYQKQVQKQNPEHELQAVVVAHGNKELAIKLMTEGLRQGINPILDEEEFPDAQLRESIVQAAKEKAQQDVGFKFVHKK